MCEAAAAPAPVIPEKRLPVHPKARRDGEHFAASLDDIERTHAVLGDRGRRQVRAKAALVSR